MDLREKGICGVTEYDWLRIESDDGEFFCEYSNEPSGSINKAGYSLKA
jgi:hypothetical protein